MYIAIIYHVTKLPWNPQNNATTQTAHFKIKKYFALSNDNKTLHIQSQLLGLSIFRDCCFKSWEISWQNGPAPPPWSIPAQPTQLFTPQEAHIEVPHTATVKVWTWHQQPSQKNASMTCNNYHQTYMYIHVSNVVCMEIWLHFLFNLLLPLSWNNWVVQFADCYLTQNLIVDLIPKTHKSLSW